MPMTARVSAAPLVDGAKVRRLREKRGLRREDVASTSGLGIATIARIERDERQDVGVSTLKAIAEALGVSIEELLR